MDAPYFMDGHPGMLAHSEEPTTAARSSRVLIIHPIGRPIESGQRPPELVGSGSVHLPAAHLTATRASRVGAG